MNDKKEINTLELHYYFNDDSHIIDAFTRNRCEKELLAIIATISAELKIQIKVEVGVKKKGGIREFYNFLVSSEGQALATWGALFVPIVIFAITRKSKRDKEEQNLRIELLRLQIDNAQQEAKEKNLSNQNITEEQINYVLDKNIKVRKLKSNFYKKLYSCYKIEKIETSTFVGNNNKISSVVNKNEFSDYIIETDNIEPIVDEQCKIEIISPVLKKGKYKWRGLYIRNNENIEFSMNDKDFKNDVADQNKHIAFQTGTFIDCDLTIERKTDDDGNIFNSNYKVSNVQKIYVGDSILETSKGKRKRKKKEADKQQISLFPELDG